MSVRTKRLNVVAAALRRHGQVNSPLRCFPPEVRDQQPSEGLFFGSAVRPAVTTKKPLTSDTGATVAGLTVHKRLDIALHEEQIEVRTSMHV